MPQPKYVQTFNPPMRLFVLTMVLVCMGVVSVYSASKSLGALKSQVLYAGIGVICMFVLYAIDYRHWKKMAVPALMVAFLMCAVLFVPGVARRVNGARRWINLAGFTVQSSEVAKLALVIYMARMLATHREKVKMFFTGVLPATLMLGAFAMVIVAEPDFGAAFTLCGIIFGMWIAGGMRWFHLIVLWMAALPAGLMAFLLERYRMERLFAFLHQNDPVVRRGVGWQLDQSLIAIGSGGMWGVGFGNGVQKGGYLGEEAHNDFIFAIICEEWGFVVVSVLLLLYFLLIVQGWLVAWRTSDPFGSMLAAGITLMIFSGAMIHMGVALGMLPTKGLVLPFISAGGTSLIVSMSAMGILMNVARNSYTQHMHGIDEIP